FSFPGGHCQRRDRYVVAEPDAGISGEQQVWQWVDDEFVVRQQRCDESVATTKFVITDPGCQQQREFLRRLGHQGIVQVAAQRVTQVQPTQSSFDRGDSSLRSLQGFCQEVSQVEHVDVTVPQ